MQNGDTKESKGDLNIIKKVIISGRLSKFRALEERSFTKSAKVILGQQN